MNHLIRVIEASRVLSMKVPVTQEVMLDSSDVSHLIKYEYVA